MSEQIATPPIPMRTTAAVNLRAEPNGQILTTVRKGIVVAVDGPLEVDGWVRVVIDGWMAKQYLEAV